MHQGGVTIACTIFQACHGRDLMREWPEAHVNKHLINYIWSLKYTSTLEIQHFLAVIVSIAYNRYGTCKVRKEITHNKNKLTKKVSLHFHLIKHGQYCAWFHWVRVRTAQLGLTVVCETKWDETKWNETKWDETKWKSVVCEMKICSLRNEDFLSRCVYSDILNRKFPPKKTVSPCVECVTFSLPPFGGMPLSLLHRFLQWPSLDGKTERCGYMTGNRSRFSKY